VDAQIQLMFLLKHCFFSDLAENTKILVRNCNPYVELRTSLQCDLNSKILGIKFSYVFLSPYLNALELIVI
jgi:hypothetical protein